MSLRLIFTALIAPFIVMLGMEGLWQFVLPEIDPTSYIGKKYEGIALTLQIIWWLCLAFIIRGSIRVVHDIVSSRVGHPVIGAKFFWEVITVGVFFLIFLCMFVFVFKQDITAILATSGLVAAIIGLALQTTLSDAMSAMAINATKTYTIGNWLELEDGTQAQVIEMNWRTTRLRGYLRWDMVVPNHVMAKQKINNFSQPEAQHDLHVDVKVDSCHSPEVVQDVLSSAAQSCLYLVKDDRCIVLIDSIDNNCINYRIIITLKDFSDSYKAKDDLIHKVVDALYYAGMSTYVPQFVIKDREALSGSRVLRIDDRTSLERNPLFSNLDPEELDALMPELKLLQLQPGDVLFEEGDEGDSMFIVTMGLLGAYITKDGQQLEVNRIGGGSFFGEMSLLTQKPRSAAIKALTHVRVFELNSCMLRKVFKDNPTMVEDLALAMQNRIAHQAIEEQRLSTTKQGKKRRMSGFEFARNILGKFMHQK